MRMCWKAILGMVLVVFCAAAVTGADETPKDAGHPLRIGLIPEQNIFKQIRRYQPLADYLAAKIGRPVELRTLTRYGNIVDNFLSEDLDGAFFGSFTYTLAYAKLGVEVLARPEYPDGTSTYYGMIFVRKDSGITTAADMKDHRFALVDKATTAGYLLPLAYFKQNGIADYRTYLKENYFTGTHEDAIYDVLNRKADIGAAKNTVFYRLAKTDPRLLNELVILEKSREVPANGLAVRKDFDPALKTRLRAALISMDVEEEGQEVLKQFGATRFLVTSLADYQPVLDFCATIGLDLASYDYMNE